MLELDVTSEEHLAALPDRLREAGVDRLDGVLHAIGFAPPGALGGNFMTATWADVATAVQISTFSLMSLTRAALPLLTRALGGRRARLRRDRRLARLRLDGRRQGRASSRPSRYLARELGPHGIRVNLVAAGPLRTMAAKSIPGFEAFEDDLGASGRRWAGTSATPSPAARACVALLSDWFPATTGEIVHVDGGVHAVGA